MTAKNPRATVCLGSGARPNGSIKPKCAQKTTHPSRRCKAHRANESRHVTLAEGFANLESA